MLIASGNVNLSQLFDGIIAMASDQTKLHGFNKNKGLGSFQHLDGWGIAYLDENDNWILRKSTKPILNDPLVEELREVKTKLAIIHARKGSKGGRVVNNNHPFQYNNYTFCHNGHIRNPIKYNKKYHPLGDTDSERLFYAIISNLNEQRNNFTQAIGKTLRQNNYCKGSNLVFANKEDSYIAIKENTRPEYYNMCLGKNKDQVIVSSEILANIPGLKWEELPSGSLVRIINKTGKHYVTRNLKFTPLKSLSLLRFSSRKHLFVPPKSLHYEQLLQPQ